MSNQFIKISNELIEFIENSPSAFHVTDNFTKMFNNAGFTRLAEKDKWKLTSGGKYYVCLLYTSRCV